jgi:type VI secretion system secreted protein VgrG
MKSRSSPGGKPTNFNEIKFEDKIKHEEFFMQAERNMTVSVKADRSESIGHDQSESVKNDKNITVGGKHTETIKKDTKITVSEGNYDLNIDKGKQTVKVAVGDALLNVDAAARKVKVAQEYDLSAKKIVAVAREETASLTAKTAALVKSESAAVTLDGATAVTLVCGGTKLNLDTAKATGEAADTISFTVGGGEIKINTSSITMTMGGSEVVIDPAKVTLKSGTGEVILDPAGVTINGAKVKIN